MRTRHGGASLVLALLLLLAAQPLARAFSGESLHDADYLHAEDYAAGSSSFSASAQRPPAVAVDAEPLTRGEALLASLDDEASAEDDAMPSVFDESVLTQGAQLETVARVENGAHRPRSGAGSGTASKSGGGGSESSTDDEVTHLIDAQDNLYVLSKASGSLAQMALLEDMTLIRDLAVLILTTAVGGLAAAALKQPVLLGHLAAGALCGPGGLGLIEEMVQVETVAQLGVVFLLFGLGVEFDASRVRRVRRAALAGTALQLAALATGGAMLAVLAGAPASAGAFAGVYIQQSSTVLVLKCLQDGRALATPYGEIMLALLLVQDVMLGVLLSLLPAFGGPDDEASDGGSGAARRAGGVAWRALRAGVALAAALGGAAAGARHGGPRRSLERMAGGAGGAERALLALCAVCLGAALAAHAVGLSLEVGAFAGGLLLSPGFDALSAAPAEGSSSATSQSHDHADATSSAVHSLLEPVRTFFGALFLAAVGMTMQFHFLWAHLPVLLAAAVGIGAAKAGVTAASLAACGVPRRTALACGLGMSNVGELGFVLLSRARGMGLVSRPLFLLLTGTTALSLWAAPAVFAGGVRRVARSSGRAGTGRTSGVTWGGLFGDDGGGLPLTAAAGLRAGAGLRVRDARRTLAPFAAGALHA